MPKRVYTVLSFTTVCRRYCLFWECLGLQFQIHAINVKLKIEREKWTHNALALCVPHWTSYGTMHHHKHTSNNNKHELTTFTTLTLWYILFNGLIILLYYFIRWNFWLQMHRTGNRSFYSSNNGLTFVIGWTTMTEKNGFFWFTFMQPRKK